MEEKIDALLENKDFVSKLMSCKEAVSLKALFAENGIELTAEQCEAVIKSLSAAVADGELDDAALEEVAGGKISLKNILKKIIKGITGGWMNSLLG